MIVPGSTGAATTTGEAALAAGRSPGDVRRLLTISGRFTAASSGLLQGPAQQWVAELALDHG